MLRVLYGDGIVVASKDSGRITGPGDRFTQCIDVDYRWVVSDVGPSRRKVDRCAHYARLVGQSTLDARSARSAMHSDHCKLGGRKTLLVTLF